MLFDDDIPNTPKGQPKNLEPMSVSELEDYINDLKSEIIRVEEDIKKKKAHQDAAASVFK